VMRGKTREGGGVAAPSRGAETLDYGHPNERRAETNEQSKKKESGFGGHLLSRKKTALGKAQVTENKIH